MAQMPCMADAAVCALCFLVYTLFSVSAAASLTFRMETCDLPFDDPRHRRDVYHNSRSFLALMGFYKQSSHVRLLLLK